MLTSGVGAPARAAPAADPAVPGRAAALAALALAAARLLRARRDRGPGRRRGQRPGALRPRRARGQARRAGAARGSGFGSGGVALAAAWFLAYATLALSFIARQILGFRRAAGDLPQTAQVAAERRGGGGRSARSPPSRSGTPRPPSRSWRGLGYFAVAALPAAIGVGVLRYRLYEIDRLISRTLSYLLLTGNPRRHLHRAGRADDRCARALQPRRRRGLDAGRRSAAAPAARPRAATRRSAVQPHALRRRGDGCGIHGAPARRGRARGDPRRPPRRGQPGRGTQPRLAVDQALKRGGRRFAAQEDNPATPPAYRPGNRWCSSSTTLAVSRTRAI